MDVPQYGPWSADGTAAIRRADWSRWAGGVVGRFALNQSNPKHHILKQRIGVMGGTFDPIHHGHLVAASEVAFLLGLHRVLFVPAGSPWQKAAQSVSSAQHRAAMVSLALAEDPRFELSTVDIDRQGPTYAVDTLRDVHRMCPDSHVFFITGSDAFSRIATWKDAAQLWDLAHFVAVTRPGHEVVVEGVPEGASTSLGIPALAISSTDIRERVSQSRPIRYMVPHAVHSYIDAHGLYR